MKRSKNCTEGSLHIQKKFFKNKQKTPKNPRGASISPQYSRFFPCIQRHLNLGYSLWITQNVWSWTQSSPSTDYTGDHTVRPFWDRVHDLEPISSSYLFKAILDYIRNLFKKTSCALWWLSNSQASLQGFKSILTAGLLIDTYRKFFHISL